jgi:hypothetical protein
MIGIILLITGGFVLHSVWNYDRKQYVGTWWSIYRFFQWLIVLGCAWYVLTAIASYHGCLGNPQDDPYTYICS